MCNDYRLTVDLDTIAADFSDLKIKIDFPDGAPNIEARDDIKITDVAPILRTAADGVVQLVQRRWSWPGNRGKPVYNFQSEGRDFGSNRCLILANGFYEFTDPLPIATEPKEKLKDKWLFTMPERTLFCIAGIYRQHPEVGEAFTMLTIDAGPDIAPFHSRQIIPLRAEDWARWLDPAVPAEDILRALPAGSLAAQLVREDDRSGTVQHPVTPDGRYFVVRGRLWRMSNPALSADRRESLVAELMAARRAIGAARRQGDEAQEAAAHDEVDKAKHALGERGPVWWDDGAPDLNRKMVKKTEYADWFETLENAA